jgi:hypothetical protein
LSRHEHARPKLLGTYTPPAFRYGNSAFCEMRGEVVLVGLSAAPIP